MLPLIWVAIAKAGGKDYDNAAPREFLDKQSGIRQRANWAQKNGFEALPAFAAGTIIAHLAGIKRTAANVLAIDSRNKALLQELTDAEIKVSILEQENQEFSRQQTRYWFLSGALVLFVGVILGLWLPRIRWQRRSRYDSF